MADALCEVECVPRALVQSAFVALVTRVFLPREEVGLDSACALIALAFESDDDEV
jgi:hypothetical protein